MMQKQLEEVCRRFSKLKNDLATDLPIKLNLQQIAQQELRCISLMEKMGSFNDYSRYGDIASIQEKYKLIKQSLEKAKSQKLSQRQQRDQVKKILRQNGMGMNNHLNYQSIESSDIHSQDVVLPRQNKTLDAFFKKKEVELANKESSFKRILNSKQFQGISHDSVSNKSVSKYSRFSKSNLKRDEQKSNNLKQVIDEHKKAIANLQTKIKQDEQLNDFEKNLLKEERNRYIEKMDELQEEIQQLYRDNYRLKELQKTAKPSDSFNISELKQKNSFQQVYEPYVIKTRTNNLNKINEMNQNKMEARQKNKQKLKDYSTEQDNDYLGEKLMRQKPITAQQFFNKKPANFGLYEQKFPQKYQIQNNLILNDLLMDSFEQNKSPIVKSPNSINNSVGSIGNGNHFDTFQMAHTLSYINDSNIGDSRNVVRMTKQVSTRNKVAFFKNSLVLIRSSQIQVAFKRSQLNEKMNKIRCIFYINNKTTQVKKITFNYEYQIEYFQIRVQQRLTQVQPKSQGREVIEITLISNIDLNGVSDVHLTVGNQTFDLWLPINFIRFKNSNSYRLPNDTMEMTVLPDRQFSSFNVLQQIVPIMYGGSDQSQTWAYLYGQSKFGNFPIKLTWKGKQLAIETTQKWLDFIGFVVHFFK